MSHSHVNGSTKTNFHHLSVNGGGGRKSASPTVHHTTTTGGGFKASNGDAHHHIKKNGDSGRHHPNPSDSVAATNNQLLDGPQYHHNNNNHQIKALFPLYDNNITSASLKLPVTPTRSKSLSPSPRGSGNGGGGGSSSSTENVNSSNNNNAFQHPRLRHKTHHFKNSQNGGGGGDSSSSVNESEQSTETVFEPIEKATRELQPVADNKRTRDDSEYQTTASCNKTVKPIPKLVYQKDHIDLTFDSSNNNNNNNNNNESHHGASSSLKSNDNKQESSDRLDFKLPVSLRNVTLNNFPMYQTPNNAKRNQSIVMTKLKSANNTDESLRILKNNITCIMSDRIREAIESCKKEFLYPALHNMHTNKNSLVSSDVSFFMASLVDEIKTDLVQEMGPERQEFKLNLDDEVAASATMKRKNNARDESEKKKIDLGGVKRNKRDESSNGSQDNKQHSQASKQDMMIKRSSAPLRFDSSTKFVLGKSVNELFLKKQQDQLSLLTVNKNETQEEEIQQQQQQGKTSVYAKYPHLLKYDPDFDDRVWLSENNIISRKNLKCYLLMWSQVREIFDDDDLDHHQHSTTTTTLKPFHLPEFIVYKINKQHFLERKKC